MNFQSAVTEVKIWSNCLSISSPLRTMPVKRLPIPQRRDSCFRGEWRECPKHPPYPQNEASRNPTQAASRRAIRVRKPCDNFTCSLMLLFLVRQIGPPVQLHVT